MIYSFLKHSNLKQLVTFFIIVLSQLQQIHGYKLLNCYSSLPSSFTKDDTNEFQSSSLCYSTCSAKGYTFFALANHSDCYCGSSSPADLSISTSCNTNCYGYGQEMCGGTSSFSIYSVDDNESVDDSAKSDTTTTGASTKVSSASSKATTTTNGGKNTVSALGVASSGSQIVVVANGQTTNTASTLVSDVVATSVVYSTQLETQGGSTIFVTNTITKSTQVMPTGNSTSTNANTGASHKKKKANVGAIVGGVVGGVCGAVIVAAIVLLGLRHYNMKREEARMEKEYQEAIKPVEYVPNDILSSSSHSYSFDGGNMNGKMGHDMNMMNDSLGMTTLPANNLMDNGSNNSNLNNNGTTNGNPNTSNNLLANPFDDSRRISTGSIFTEDTDPNKPTKLTIVNPDE